MSIISSILETIFEWGLAPCLNPDDGFVDILRKIICSMYGIATMFGLAVPYYAWKATQVSDQERGAVIALTVLVGLFGFVMCLPTFLYMRCTKSAPDWLMIYCLVMAAIITCSWDVFTTFFPVRSTSIAIALMTVGSRVTGGLYIVAFLVIYYLVIEARDAFDLPLRVSNPYEGSGPEKLIFSFPGILAMVLMPAMMGGMVHEYIKLISAAKSSVKLAQEVAELLMVYDTDGVREQLTSAKKQNECLELALVTAFEQISENLDIYRPHLPAYVLPRDDAYMDEEGLDLYDNGDESRDWASTQGGGGGDNNSLISTRTMRLRQAARKRQEDLDSLASDNASVNSSSSNLQHQQQSSSGKYSNGGSFGDYNPNANSGGLGSGSDGSPKMVSKSRSGDVYGTKRVGSSGKNHHQVSSSKLKSSSAPNNNHHHSSSVTRNQISASGPKTVGAATSFLTGTFVERIVFCRVNLAKLPKIIFGENLRSNSDIATPVINQIMENLLDLAAQNEGTVHAVVADCIAISWNAAVRVVHGDLKACRFLVGLDGAVRKALLSSSSKKRFLERRRKSEVNNNIGDTTTRRTHIGIGAKGFASFSNFMNYSTMATSQNPANVGIHPSSVILSGDDNTSNINFIETTTANTEIHSPQNQHQSKNNVNNNFFNKPPSGFLSSGFSPNSFSNLDQDQQSIRSYMATRSELLSGVGVGVATHNNYNNNNQNVFIQQNHHQMGKNVFSLQTAGSGTAENTSFSLNHNNHAAGSDSHSVVVAPATTTTNAQQHQHHTPASVNLNHQQNASRASTAQSFMNGDKIAADEKNGNGDSQQPPSKNKGTIQNQGNEKEDDGDQINNKSAKHFTIDMNQQQIKNDEIFLNNSKTANPGEGSSVVNHFGESKNKNDDDSTTNHSQVSQQSSSQYSQHPPLPSRLHQNNHTGNNFDNNSAKSNSTANTVVTNKSQQQEITQQQQQQDKNSTSTTTNSTNPPISNQSASTNGPGVNNKNQSGKIGETSATTMHNKSNGETNPKDDHDEDDELLASVLPEVILTAAAVTGSGWAQVAGSSKRQQFMLSAFSNSTVLDEASRTADRGDFIAVCRQVQASAQLEFNLRGCGVVPNVNGLKYTFNSCNQLALNTYDQKVQEVSASDSVSNPAVFTSDVAQQQREQTTVIQREDTATSLHSPVIEQEQQQQEQKTTSFPENNNNNNQRSSLPPPAPKKSLRSQLESHQQQNSFLLSRAQSLRFEQMQQQAQFNFFLNVITTGKIPAAATQQQQQSENIKNNNNNYVQHLAGTVGGGTSSAGTPGGFLLLTPGISPSATPGTLFTPKNLNDHHHHLSPKNLHQKEITNNTTGAEIQIGGDGASATTTTTTTTTSTNQQTTAKTSVAKNHQLLPGQHNNLNSPGVGGGDTTSAAAAHVDGGDEKSKNNNHNNNSSKKLPVIAAPLYELVSKKKMAKDDDEWLYVINEKKDGIDPAQIRLEAQCTALCDAVAYLARGQIYKTIATMNKLLEEHPSSGDLPAFQSVEYSLERCAGLIAANPEQFPQFFSTIRQVPTRYAFNDHNNNLGASFGVFNESGINHYGNTILNNVPRVSSPQNHQNNDNITSRQQHQQDQENDDDEDGVVRNLINVNNPNENENTNYFTGNLLNADTNHLHENRSTKINHQQLQQQYELGAGPSSNATNSLNVGGIINNNNATASSVLHQPPPRLIRHDTVQFGGQQQNSSNNHQHPLPSSQNAEQSSKTNSTNETSCGGEGGGSGGSPYSLLAAGGPTAPGFESRGSGNDNNDS